MSNLESSTLLSKGCQLFTLFRAKQFDDEAASKRTRFPTDFWPRVHGEWNALPDHIKAQWEVQGLAYEKKRATAKAQHSLPQSSPRDPPSPALKKEPSMEWKAYATAAMAAAMQHMSSSSSATPSPSTPGLSPSPLYSPRPASHAHQSIPAGQPASSQPGPFNPGDSWSGARHGTSAEVTSLMEHHPPHSQAGRETATAQIAHPHLCGPPGTSAAPPLHASQQPARTAPLRRTQTVLLTPITMSSVVGVPTPDANAVRRFNSVPSTVLSSNTGHTPQVTTPLIHTPPVVSPSQQFAHPALLGRHPSIHAVERSPAGPDATRQPTPSTPYAGVAPHASPVPKGQALTPIIEEDSRVYTSSAAAYHGQVTPARAAVPLSPNSDYPTSAQAPATPTVPVASHALEFGTGPPQALWSPSVMELLRQIPTPVPDVVDVDAFLGTILAPQFLPSSSPEFARPTEDNAPFPDALQVWPPGPLPEDVSGWLSSGYPTGWEDFNGFPEA